MVTLMNPSIGSGYLVEKNFLRIGDTQFYVPPTSIKVFRQTQLEMQKMIRSKGSSPKESGHYEQIIEFSIIFPDIYSINNELRPLLAQSKKFPFLPVENTYLNDSLAIEAVTITNITCQTVVGFPNCITAIVQAYAFNPASYVYGDEGSYDEMFDWKMFRWHYNRNLSPSAKKQGLTYFERITTDLHNEFKFKIAAEDELEAMKEWRVKKNKLIRDWRNDKKNKPGFDTEDWTELGYKIFAPEEERSNYFNDEKDEEQFFKEYNKLMSEKMNTYDVDYDPVPMSGLMLLDMSVSLSNDIATHQAQMSPYSTHQFLGSSDVVASMRFIAQDEEVVQALDATLNQAAYLTREYNKEMASGFVKFDHQLTRLFGIENVVVGDVSYNTIPNQPGVQEVNMTLYGYSRGDQRTHETEAMMSGSDIDKLWSISKGEDARWPWLIPGVGPAYAFMNTPLMKQSQKALGNMDASITMDEEKQAVYDAHVMEMLKAIELYPDLELPTYVELKNAGFSVPNLNDGFYVDPDFFLKYTNDSYYKNLLLAEMKKKYSIEYIDGGGGGAKVSSSDYSKAEVNSVTKAEVEEINKELGASKEKKETTSTEKKEYPAPKNPETKLVEAWIREEANRNEFPQNYALGFAQYFDSKLRHTYEKGTNKDFGQISADTDNRVIEMNSVSSYVVGEYKKNNYVGVMRVPFNAPEEITDIHGNVLEGVMTLSTIYKNRAYPMVEVPTGYKNMQKAYALFGIKNDGTSKHKSQMQIVIASIMYMGGDRAIKEYLSGRTDKLDASYEKLGKGVIKKILALGNKWSDEEITKAIDKKIEEYKTTEYSKDMSSEPATFEDNTITDIANDEVVRNAMLVDSLKYDQRGRMVRAFPTFLLTFVDEGQYVGNVKMADQYFNYRAVQDIVYNHSRKQAAPTLMLELSNIFESLSDAEKAEDLSHQGFKDMMNYWMRPGAYAKETQDRTRHMDDAYYKSIYLKTGVRVHFRLGYGSNPMDLPTLLNGPITSMKNNGSSISIVCQGDGIELTRSLSSWFSPDDETTGFLWAKKEPTHILDELLTDDRGLMANVKTLLSNKEYEHHSMGLMHFGSPGTPINHTSLAQSVIGGALGGLIGGWSMSKHLNEVSRDLRPININVHQTTGIANGTDTLWNRMGDFFGMGQGDEDGVAFSLFDKTIWDVACINASIGTDMLAAVHPFGFRSTLFVGKPYFPIHYDYNVNDDKSAVAGTKVKTFRQVHSVDSYTNIISNNIEATEQNMYTTAVGTFMRNGELAATDTVYVDTNIWPEKQKNVVVDTTLNAKGFRLLKAAGKIPVIGGIADAINSKTGQWLFDEGVALKMTYAGLREHVKEMYDGYLTMMGLACIKPYDHMVLQDTYLNMGGVFEVREVTHMMNNQVGFISMIKPDVVVYNSDSRIGHFSIGASQIAGAAGMTMILRAALKHFGFKGNFPIMQSMWAATKWTMKKTIKLNKIDVFYDKMKGLFSKRKNPNVAGTTGEKADVVSAVDEQRNKDLVNPDMTKEELANSKKRGLLRKVAVYLDAGSEAQVEEMLKNGIKNQMSKHPKTLGRMSESTQKKLNKTITKTIFNDKTKLAVKMAKGARNSFRLANAALGLAAGPIGIIATAIEMAVVEVVTATVGEFLNRWLTNRQCCIIIPMKKDGVRLLAGVNGHKGSVAGDSQDFIGSIAGSTVGSFLLGFIGVDGSRYQNTPDDPGDYGVSSLQLKSTMLRSEGLLDEIKKRMPSLNIKNRIDSGRDKTSKYLHRLDIAGVKARIENKKNLLEKLASLIPKYDQIKETFKSIASAIGSALTDGLTKLKKIFGGLWDDISGLFDDIFDLENKDDLSCTSEMPTAANYKGPSKGAHGQTNLKSRIAGTDKYNDLIFKIGKKRGINPVFIKVIMAIETAGVMNLKSSANCYGLMQVKNGDNNNYNFSRMLTDAEYAINAGCDIIEEKMRTSTRLKKNVSVKWVAQYYYGYMEGWSQTYGNQAVEMYKGLGYDTNTTDTKSQVVTGECAETSSVGGGTAKVSGVNPSTWPKSAGWGDAEQQKASKTRSLSIIASPQNCPNIRFPFGPVKARPDAITIANQVAKEYKAKFGEKMAINSALRSGESKSWHYTGWGMDIDVPGTDNGGHMVKFKNGTRGYSDNASYQKAKFLAERFIYYGYDGIVFGETRIKAELLKIYPKVNWTNYGQALGDHDGHLHVCAPNQNRLK